MRIDLHTHSRLSDGTDSVEALVEAACRAGLGAIALTDHDTMAGVDRAQQVGGAVGIEVLRGVEMSTHADAPGEERSVHLLGYGCSPTDTALEELLEQVRQSRLERVPNMLIRLAELGLPLELAEVAGQATAALSLGRPHVADAMVARGYVRSRDEAFQRYLDESCPAYVRHFTPPLSEAIDAINHAGGVAVIAHPWGRGNNLISVDLLGALHCDHGLFGVEVDHPDHTEEQRQTLRARAKAIGLVATGSSDYHGKGKTRNPLGAFCTEPGVYQHMRSAIAERGGRP